MKKTAMFYLVFAAAGAATGYVYYAFYGCMHGCAISSVWYNSSAYGALMGAFTGGIFKEHFIKLFKKSNDEK